MILPTSHHAKRILWLAWKDAGHPARGGAEVVLDQLINRQIGDGQHVTLLTARYPGAAREETLPSGLHIIRVGSNRYTHPIMALFYYVRYLRHRYDVIIETVNTMPYLSLLFRGKTKGLAFYHQLARDIWFFETKSPVSHLGYYVVEPLYTWLLSRAKAPLVTVSESTKRDIARYGWHPSRTHIISEGICMQPVAGLERSKKFAQPTIVSLGTVRGMKRTLDQIKAFEIAKKDIPNLQFKLAGDTSDTYGRRVIDYIAHSPYAADIQYLGRVNDADKQLLMRRSHVITVTSVKEGWGLIVTEAASQGTPAVVYDADGLRDSVRHLQTGLITKPTPGALAKGITQMLGDSQLYSNLQQAGWQWGKQLTFDKSYKDFKHILQEAKI